MATKNLNWGILTSGLASMFFLRHEAVDTNGEFHHILVCSELVNCDATGPSLFSLCAATLLGRPDGLVVRPTSKRFTLRPYSLPRTVSTSTVTRSNVGRHRG